MIKEILLLPNSKTDTKLSKTQENFLLSLLKNDKTELFKDIVKSFDISKEELLEIFKHQPKELKTKILELIKNFESKKEKNVKIKEKPSQSTEIKEFLSNILNNNVKTEHFTNKDEKKIVEIIKKEIISKLNLTNKLNSKKEIHQFKQIKTLKELISFANKKGLNIQKITLNKPQKEEIIKIITSTPSKKAIFEIKPKIVIPENNTKIKPNKHRFQQSLITKIVSNKTQTTAKIQTPPQTPTLNKILNNFNNLETKIFKKDEHKEIKPQINSHHIHTEIKHNIFKAKESIKHFASNLKEAIENYKPPISKVSIELNPKELGKVEITLLHRGENLQIQVNGQNQTINFFNQYQHDLKSILVNMGYSDVNMSFNQNNQQKNQEKYKQQQTLSLKDEDEFIIEIPYQYA